MKISYLDPILTENVLSDGSKVHSVKIYGVRIVELHCIDKESAENLMHVWEHSVISMELI